MDATTYTAERVQAQINWMSKEARLNQQRYKLLKVLEIVAAALIPFLAGYHRVHPGFAIATGALGVFIVLLNGLHQLYKFHENWLTYRTTAEALKREKLLFESASDPYQDGGAFKKFVQNVEGILSNENKLWKTTLLQKPDQQQTKET